MLNNILRKIFLLRQTYFKKVNKNFYSQFGEDKILNEIIPKKLKNGFYVDVGCFHPKKYSNTYMLYKKGWKGINIDMEKDKIEAFKIARPNDFNFLGAVSDKVEKVKIFRNQKYGVSSTLNENMINKDNIIDEKFIETCTLNYILNLSPFKKFIVSNLFVETVSITLGTFTE